jgi:hypothetical protein
MSAHWFRPDLRLRFRLGCLPALSYLAPLGCFGKGVTSYRVMCDERDESDTPRAVTQRNVGQSVEAMGSCRIRQMYEERRSRRRTFLTGRVAFELRRGPELSGLEFAPEACS